MAGLLERLTRDLVRRGIRDGLLGGNGAWLAVGAVAWALRFVSRKPSVRVVTETLRVGETISVTCVPAVPFGRSARKIARAEKQEAKAARSEIRGERHRANEAETAETRPPAGSG